MIKINFIKNSKDVVIPDGAKRLIRTACKKVLDIENFCDNAEINVTFVDDEEIKRLNAEFRHLDKSTDVLSFPLGEDGEYDINPETNAAMLGDVVISLEHAIAQANAFGHSLKRETAFLTVHSILHLLGYDHVNSDEEDKLMRSKQSAVLHDMGLAVNNKE